MEDKVPFPLLLKCSLCYYLNFQYIIYSMVTEQSFPRPLSSLPSRDLLTVFD